MSNHPRAAGARPTAIVMVMKRSGNPAESVGLPNDRNNVEAEREIV
jgi:hypothetical protein